MPIAKSNNQYANSVSNCQTCVVTEFCLPVGLRAEDLSRLNQLVSDKIELARGEFLCRYLDPQTHVFAISEGFLKAFQETTDGRSQIKGFHFSGELIGIEAIASGRFPASIEALTTTRVCKIALNDLLALACQLPNLQRQLFMLMSKSVVFDYQIPRNSHASERLAIFLLEISARLQRSGANVTDINLPMSRQDIADYLGLALETVSRQLTQMQQAKLVNIHGRHLKILNLRGLQQVACR